MRLSLSCCCCVLFLQHTVNAYQPGVVKGRGIVPHEASQGARRATRRSERGLEAARGANKTYREGGRRRRRNRRRGVQNGERATVQEAAAPVEGEERSLSRRRPSSDDAASAAASSPAWSGAWSQPMSRRGALLHGAAAGPAVLLAATCLGSGAADAVAAEGSAAAVSQPQVETTQAIFGKAAKRALGGGASGASAAAVQVVAFIPLRTTMNYQYRFGSNTKAAMSKLWAEGGFTRFYQGLPVALVQGPMSRFGDVAASAGVLLLLDSLDSTQGLPLPIKAACAAVVAGMWRVVILPLDTLKTNMQVEGRAGLGLLKAKIDKGGVQVLFEGALAASAATCVGHFPWYLTYNYLQDALPQAPVGDTLLKLLRTALLGLCASCVSDTCSNSLRVVKTTKQTAPEATTYAEIYKSILAKDGVFGLLGRGLQTRLLVNALQGAFFSVSWKYFEGVLGVK